MVTLHQRANRPQQQQQQQQQTKTQPSIHTKAVATQSKTRGRPHETRDTILKNIFKTFENVLCIVTLVYRA